MTTFKRFLILWGIITVMLFMSGCAGNWVSQASTIITALEPAISAALALLLTFGVKVAPDVTATIQGTLQSVMDDLKNIVLPLLEKYEAETPEEQHNVIKQIDDTLTAISKNLSTVLGQLPVQLPDVVKQKVAGIIQAVIGMVASLMALIPTVKMKGTVTLEDAHEANLMSAKQFKHVVNNIMTAPTGDQEIDHYTASHTI